MEVIDCCWSLLISNDDIFLAEIIALMNNNSSDDYCYILMNCTFLLSLQNIQIYIFLPYNKINNKI